MKFGLHGTTAKGPLFEVDTVMFDEQALTREYKTEAAFVQLLASTTMLCKSEGC